MKIEVAKPDLEAALQVVSIGAASTGSDLTTHFVFRYQEEDNSVEVLSNNNRVGCSMPLQGAKISLDSDDQAFTVEAWRLNKWISASEDSVLTLEYKEGIVKATGPKGSVKFQSLDPAQFSYWDKTLAEVEKGKTIAAKRLQNALSHSKMFISDKDTTQPKLAVTEIRKSALQATDKGALAVVVIEDLDGSELRVHGKDLGHVMSFLGQSGDETVELKEHDKFLFIVRHDGGILTVTRPMHPFPDVHVDVGADSDAHYWVLKRDEVVSAINSLVASASREDTRVNFKLVKDGVVGISMTSASGDKVTLHLETQSQTIPAPEGEEDTVIQGFGAQEDAAEMPEEGFELVYPYLLRTLGQWKDDMVRFGINPKYKDGKLKGGYTRFREVREDDLYVTLLVWPS
jgi:DNA polymerase III sliding clamp (beta) subunit (PCNA family)